MLFAWFAMAYATPQISDCMVVRPVVMTDETLPPSTAFPVKVGSEAVLVTLSEVTQDIEALKMYDVFSAKACGQATNGMSVAGVRVFELASEPANAAPWTGAMPEEGASVYLSARGAPDGRLLRATVLAPRPGQIAYRFEEPVSLVGMAGAPVFNERGNAIGVHVSFENESTAGRAIPLDGLPVWLGKAEAMRKEAEARGEDSEIDLVLGPVEPIQPQPVRWVKPRYPKAAKRANVAAMCVSNVTLDDDGRPTSITTRGCSAMFVASVERALRKCKWEAARKGLLRKVTVYSPFGEASTNDGGTTSPDTFE